MRILIEIIVFFTVLLVFVGVAGAILKTKNKKK